MGDSAIDSDLWHVELSSGEVHVITLDQLDDAFNRGLVNEQTRVWQEGMGERCRSASFSALSKTSRCLRRRRWLPPFPRPPRPLRRGRPSCPCPSRRHLRRHRRAHRPRGRPMPSRAFVPLRSTWETFRGIRQTATPSCADARARRAGRCRRWSSRVPSGRVPQLGRRCSHRRAEPDDRTSKESRARSRRHAPTPSGDAARRAHHAARRAVSRRAEADRGAIRGSATSGAHGGEHEAQGPREGSDPSRAGAGESLRDGLQGHEGREQIQSAERRAMSAIASYGGARPKPTVLGGRGRSRFCRRCG